MVIIMLTMMVIVLLFLLLVLPNDGYSNVDDDWVSVVVFVGSDAEWWLC